MNNLWPNFDDMEKIENPKAILEQQAKNLLKVTKDMAYGSVEINKMVIDEDDIAKEFGREYFSIVVNSQTEFEEEIRKVFSSNKVKRVIQSIISLS